MRLHGGIAWVALIAALVLSLGWPAFGQGKKPAHPGPNDKPAKAEDAPEAAEKDGPLTLDDITRMRRKHVPHNKIIEKVTEQGVDFELTPAVKNQLRRMGFTAKQVDAVKEAYQGNAEDGPAAPGKLVPGQGLRTTDAQRAATYEEIRKITKASGADLQPAPAQHITLWAAQDVQAVFLPDIKKVEDFLRTKCKEPIRSGLDKRAAHVILIKRRYEFEKWVEAMFALIGDRFKDPNDPGGNTELKRRILKSGGFYTDHFVIFLLEEETMDRAHRSVAAGVGYMYFNQLAENHPDPLSNGFANGTECVLAGTPSVMISGIAYGAGDRNLGKDPRAWIRLVQQRITARQVSTVSQLLKMDATNMLLPHYAEAWTLVTLLAKQPEKFAALVLKLREERSPLKAIEEVYGWDENKLTEEWHKFVLGQR